MKIFWIQDVNYGDLDYKEDILSVLGLLILFQVDVIAEHFVIVGHEKFKFSSLMFLCRQLNLGRSNLAAKT